MTQDPKRAVILLADKFQDEEGVEPAVFLRERGVEVVFAGLAKGTVAGKYGRLDAEVTHTVDEIAPEDYDLLLLPGGAAPETLRLDERVLALTRAFMELPGKLVAAICHGPQILISAKVLPGRLLTCYQGIRDDVMLAGARYVDRKVVVDGRLITSRTPGDLPAFHEAIAVALLGEGEGKEPAPAPVDEADWGHGLEPDYPEDLDETADPGAEGDLAAAEDETASSEAS